ncbi:putative TIM-barrel fold metal-dependent hydrolase [Aliiruegeria haliotis]|uniref:Putative TIM-barrel fold metal-dependent hydrolase n=1 Tax=Aliiruegeria haliotis TaxID=1280846 RepID=A0A2T0RLW6_9RHOB|nr:amidohydrolase family protein [Aliiruegeria haliotis]PRY22127.1 putative TIM-barrel fold metal-dependent hydrolase [Aliiruegeria haliotis]
MIDTQAHILDPARFPYPSPCPGYRPAPDEIGTIEMLLQQMDRTGISRAVLVQPSTYGTDNSAILTAMAGAPERFRAVVVARNDPDEITRLARQPGVCGVRLNLTHSRELPAEISALRDMARRIASTGLLVQVQGTPETLPSLLDGLDDVPVLIDHFGRLDVSNPASVAAICRLADAPGNLLKVSGGFRLAPSGDWRNNLSPFEQVMAAFGPERLVWGSDWPFINHDGPTPTYTECLDWGRALLPDERTADATAATLFGWDNDDGG